MTNRFTIQPSEKEGFWLASDDKAGISIEFLANSFSPEELGALRERLNFECDAVENDRCLIESATACGMDK